MIKIEGLKDLAKVEWVPMAKDLNMLVLTKTSTNEVFKFCGFPDSAFEKLESHFKLNFHRSISRLNCSVEGHPFGVFHLDQECGASVRLNSAVGGAQVLDLSCSAVTKCRDLGKGELQFEVLTEGLVPSLKDCEAVCEVKFFVPDEQFLGDVRRYVVKHNPSLEQQDGEAGAALNRGLVAVFENVKVEVPRGNFKVEFSDHGLRFSGKSMEFYVKYSNIARVFMLFDSDE